MDSGRVLLTKALRCEPVVRPPFLPLVHRVAARLAGCSVQEMQSDAGLWTAGLVAAAKLLSADAVAVGYDPTLVAEGLGAQITWKNDSPRLAGVGEIHAGIPESPETTGRLSVALEVMRRLFPTVAAECGCVAMLTGPVTTAAMLCGPTMAVERARDFKAPLLRCVEAACESRPDLLLFMEGAGFLAGGITVAHKRIYGTLKNVAAYYNIPVGIFLRGYAEQEDLSQLVALGLDCVALGSAASGAFPTAAQAWALADGRSAVPYSLPGDDLARVPEELAKATQMSREAGAGFFVIVAEPDRGEFDMVMLQRAAEAIVAARL